jgi:tetratricopeptide (TPR) repeat protein
MIELLRDLRATRSAWLRWTIGGVVVAAAIALLAFGVGERRGQRALCAAAAPRLTSPWDAEARGMVQRSFANTKLAYVAQTLAHVEANLDHWSDELDTARADACEAGTFHTGAPPERLAAVLDCLEDRTREGRALINQFREADATTVLNATGATEQLRSVAECTATPATRVVAPDSPMLQQVRELFARAHALMDSGKFRDALPLAREAVTIAEAIGDPGVQSGALVSLASAQARLSDYDTAMTNLQQALRLAEQAQDDRVRAQVWVNLVQIEYWRGHFDQVVFMKAAALGATERIGDLGLETEVMLNLGGALSQLGRTREAQGLFETAVQLRRKIYGQRDRRLAFALGSLGNAYSMQGNLDAGIAAHREALASVEAALGSTHPNTGVSHGNLGDDYIYALRAPEAVTELAQDVAIAEAADGPKHRDVAMALTDLGTAQLEAGQLEAAAASAERADAIWTTVNAKHPARAEALLARYLALQALGKPAAVSDLETALTLGAGLPPFERARIQLALGRASTGARAIELVKAAAAGFATSPLPLCQRELVAAKAWLVAHGSSP